MLAVMNFKLFMIDEEKHSFSSTQINLPPRLSDEITNWADHHVENEDIYETAEPNFGREYEPHVTVLYGLHSESPKPIREAVQDFEPFKITLGKISAFTTNEAFDVLKLEVASDGLHKLNKLLATLEHTNKFSDYKPHVTLAYIKKNKCKNLINDRTFAGTHFPANVLVFSDRDRNKTSIKLAD